MADQGLLQAPPLDLGASDEERLALGAQFLRTALLPIM